MDRVLKYLVATAVGVVMFSIIVIGILHFTSAENTKTTETSDNKATTTTSSKTTTSSSSSSSSSNKATTNSSSSSSSSTTNKETTTNNSSTTNSNTTNSNSNTTTNNNTSSNTNNNTSGTIIPADANKVFKTTDEAMAYGQKVIEERAKATGGLVSYRIVTAPSGNGYIVEVTEKPKETNNNSTTSNNGN